MTTTEKFRVLRKGNCPSLSGRSELTYEFGYHEQSKTTMFRIADNTGEGHFQEAWIPLDHIIVLLEKAKGPFSLGVFKPLYSGQSINNVGFLGAALKQEGLIICEKRQYLRKDTKTFLADLNKLIKAKKTPKEQSPKRQSSKKKLSHPTASKPTTA